MVSVYFFVPNLIGTCCRFKLIFNLLGYTRVIFTCLAFYFGSEYYEYFFIFYAISQLLDAFDGYAARLLGQSSEYGAVLDMVTDR
jgi:CDP-diacylglycerol--inositol 3-phosphatidyltransferase